MAIYTALCGTTYVFPALQDEGEQQRQKAVLGYEKMPTRAQESMPGLGVSGW